MSLVFRRVLAGVAATSVAFAGTALASAAPTRPGLGATVAEQCRANENFGFTFGECVSILQAGHNSENGANTFAVYLCKGHLEQVEAAAGTTFKNQGECLQFASDLPMPPPEE